jgi:hypothetical protein
VRTPVWSGSSEAIWCPFSHTARVATSLCNLWSPGHCVEFRSSAERWSTYYLNRRELTCRSTTLPLTCDAAVPVQQQTPSESQLYFMWLCSSPVLS